MLAREADAPGLAGALAAAAFAFAASSAACGPSPAAPSRPAAASPTRAPAAPFVLALGEAKVVGASGKAVLLAADGRVTTRDGELVATVKRDGRLADAAGAEVARLDEHGAVRAPSADDEATLRIDEDGTVRFGNGATLTMRADGSLVCSDPVLFPPAELAKLKVEVSRPDVKRAIMFVFMTLAAPDIAREPASP